MCVLIYKPKGIRLDDLKVLGDCWDANSHGAGFAVVKSDNLTVVKGLMSFEDFLEAYFSMYDERLEIVLHFRLASKGSVVEHLTHPFVIGKRQPKNLIFETDKEVLFHNGTIFGLGNKDKSDTQEMAELLSELPKKYWNKILSLTGDKFVIASPKKITLVGSFHKHEGVYFSNMYWSYRYRGYRGYYDTCYIDTYSSINKDKKEE